MDAGKRRRARGPATLYVSCALVQTLVHGFVAPSNTRFASSREGPVRPRAQRRADNGLTMIIPRPEWGYVCEPVNDHPDYIPNMDFEGEAKPGATPEAYPALDLPIDEFEHGGAFESDFHELPHLDRPCYVEMKTFIDQEGLAMLPSEAEMLEREIKTDRKRRADARKERFAEEPDEDLVDDTLEDVPVGTAEAPVAAMPADASAPPVDFDENDAYDDGYDTPGDSSTVPDMEGSMY